MVDEFGKSAMDFSGAIAQERFWMYEMDKGVTGGFKEGNLVRRMVRRGKENAPNQCSSSRHYDAEVNHAILSGKAQMTFNKRVPVPKTDTDG
ncbi:hypothetical protein GOBAR_DD03804 [Gossypium barbadense]|nr:hypothetical protein GOBAR_DD03804 [Gossypium barbadense]